MNGPTPRLEIFADRIHDNARAIVHQCADHGIQVAAVTKVLHAHPALLRALDDTGITMLADSRLQNLRRIAETGTSLPTLLLRAPGRHDIDAAVQLADISLNSSLITMTALSDAAVRAGTRHGVIIMVDVGDLREGVWPDHLVEVVSAAAKLPGIDVRGVGTNLACYGGVQPSAENMTRLVQLRDLAREATGLELGLISGGNSANLPLMMSGDMPSEINNLRIGEAIILGRNTLDRSPWPGTCQDTIQVVSEIIELERKPSIPLGRTGEDAFGQHVTFTDRGVRLRAICNLGRQDVNPSGLTPIDPGHIVLGASSDHLIVDVTDSGSPVEIGTEVRFRPTYAGLLATATSSAVWKEAATPHRL